MGDVEYEYDEAMELLKHYYNEGDMMKNNPDKLTKKEEEIFEDCKGYCVGCLYEGGCDLQNKLNNLHIDLDK